MKAFVMGEIGQVGFMDKPGPGGGIGQQHNLTLGHEAVGDVVKPLITFS